MEINGTASSIARVVRVVRELNVASIDLLVLLRSASTPTAASEVTLEDIDMVAAIGDSDAAAFAAGSVWFWDYFTEYWGHAYTTGADGTYQTNPSLANLLKVCNPALEGVSTGTDSVIFPSGQGHGLNVAVR